MKEAVAKGLTMHKVHQVLLAKEQIFDIIDVDCRFSGPLTQLTVFIS